MNNFFHKDRITALELTSDKKYVVSASKDHTVKVWDVNTQELLRTILGHKDRVNDIALTPDDSRILSASDDKTIKIWDLRIGADLFTFRGHSARVSCVAVTADGRRVVSVSNGLGGRDASLKLWDIKNGFIRRSFPTDDDILMNAVALTPDGKHAVTASGLSRMALVWDMNKGKIIFRFCSDTASRKMDVSVSTDGHFVASCGDRGEINLFDIENGTEIFKLYHFKNGIYESNPWENPGLMIWDVGFYDNGRSIMSCSYEGTIKTWDTESRKVKLNYYLGTLLTACTISRDGSIIVAGDE